MARVLIGIGFAGGLMSAIKVFTLWYPPRQWGLVTGFHMMAGGAGSMAATWPVQWSLSMMTWQGLFFWLAGICLATAALLFAVVPEKPAAGRTGSLRDQFRVTGVVLTDGFYWRIQPLLAVQQLAFIGCISLWIGPWLRDVGGIADNGQRADIQLYATAATALGFGASGLISGWCRRIGISDFTCAGITSVLFALVCGWLAFLPPSHPLIAVDAVRLPRRLPDPVHAGDGVVVPARLCRPGQHQQQPRGLPGDLRRPVGDGQSRRPVAARRRSAMRRTATPGRSARCSSCSLPVWRGFCCRGDGRWRAPYPAAAD